MRSTLLAVFLLGFAGPSAAQPSPHLSVPPAEYAEFEAPLTGQLREFASGRKRPCAATIALAAVAVPADFTPDRPWPVLFVSATSDPGYNSSRQLLRRFMVPALHAGWIVLAADPNTDRDEDTDRLRYALLVAAIGRLQLEWPHFPEWPRAFGGFSGGAKRSAWLAALATALHHRPIGVFQGGCNEPAMSRALDAIRADRAEFLAVPVFLSGGTEDPIAPRDMVADVASNLRRAGFTHVRYEHYRGGHELYAAHVEEALRWFARAATSPPSGPP
ncbi:MAG TPA: hypothetical protein VHE13_01305 [Opitutus sp.]|nr:hypothetical protein [Opitutus sp.]